MTQADRYGMNVKLANAVMHTHIGAEGVATRCLLV